MKNLGFILLVIGLIGVAYFGYEAYQSTASVSAFGANVTVSKGNWTPVILSALVAVVGYVFTKRK